MNEFQHQKVFTWILFSNLFLTTFQYHNQGVNILLYKNLVPWWKYWHVTTTGVHYDMTSCFCLKQPFNHSLKAGIIYSQGKRLIGNLLATFKSLPKFLINSTVFIRLLPPEWKMFNVNDLNINFFHYSKLKSFYDFCLRRVFKLSDVLILNYFN